MSTKIPVSFPPSAPRSVPVIYGSNNVKYGTLGLEAGMLAFSQIFHEQNLTRPIPQQNSSASVALRPGTDSSDTSIRRCRASDWARGGYRY